MLQKYKKLNLTEQVYNELQQFQKRYGRKLKTNSKLIHLLIKSVTKSITERSKTPDSLEKFQ